MVAGGVELLDAIVGGVGDVDVARAVDGHAVGVLELAVGRAVAAPGGEVVAGGVELLDALVGGVGDVDVARAVGGHAVGVLELAVGRAGAAPFGGESGRAGEEQEGKAGAAGGGGMFGDGEVGRGIVVGEGAQPSVAGGHGDGGGVNRLDGGGDGVVAGGALLRPAGGQGGDLADGVVAGRQRAGRLRFAALQVEVAGAPAGVEGEFGVGVAAAGDGLLDRDGAGTPGRGADAIADRHVGEGRKGIDDHDVVVVADAVAG